MRGRPLANRTPREGDLSFTPPFYDAQKMASWPNSIKGRRPFMNLNLQLFDDANDRILRIPDILELIGCVGIERYTLKIDKHYAQDIKTVRKAEITAICDLFLEQVEKTVPDVHRFESATLGNLRVEAPVSSFEKWWAALSNRKPFTHTEIRLEESPNSQRLPTPDVIVLCGTVGSDHFYIKLDKLYDEDVKSKLKEQMLRIVELFRSKVISGMEFSQPESQIKESVGL